MRMREGRKPCFSLAQVTMIILKLMSWKSVSSKRCDQQEVQPKEQAGKDFLQ